MPTRAADRHTQSKDPVLPARPRTRQGIPPAHQTSKPSDLHSALELAAVEKNQLYYGDNLTVLRDHIKDESVDLIYLDPPFNSRQEPGSPARPVLA